MKKLGIIMAILLSFLIATPCIAGDSTTLNEEGSDLESDYNTHGGSIYTEGGNIDTESGNVYTGGGHVDTQGGRVYTRGNHIYTSGGHHYAGGGDIRDVDQLFANRVYAKGGGSWINYYDHIDMNNRIIDGAARVRVNDYTPNTYNELASKWYVDNKGGASLGNVVTRTFSCGLGGACWRDCPSGYVMIGIYKRPWYDGCPTYRIKCAKLN